MIKTKLKLAAGASLAVLGVFAAISIASAQSTTSTALTASCSGSASDNVITWTANQTGGVSPYTYLWSGNQISGNTSSSVMGTYDATGTYGAMIQINDSDSNMATSSCTADVTSMPAASSTPTSTVSSADLSVMNTVDNVNPSEGNTINFTTTVSALGPGTSTGVTAMNLLPMGLTFLSATPSVGTYATTTGMWTIGDLMPNATATLMLAATVNSGTAGTTISDTATANESASSSDPNLSNNSSTMTIAVAENSSTPTSTMPIANISIAQNVDNPNPSVGSTINYLLTVTALGPATSTGAVATDLLPMGLTFLSATPSVGTYATTTGMWTIGDLMPNATATLNIAAMVASGTEGNIITNSATVGESSTVMNSTTTNMSAATSITVANATSTSISTSTTPLSVSCDWGYDSANAITWTASVSGGTAPYTYLWSGSQLNSATSSSVTATYPSTGTYYATVQATDAASNTGSAECSAGISSIPTSTSTPTSTPSSTPSGITIPPTLTIGANGNFLARGMVVTSIASTSFQAEIWGIAYTVNWNGTLPPAFFFRNSNANTEWTPSSQLAVGDVVGVSGWINLSNPLTVNANIVRDYSILSPRMSHLFSSNDNNGFNHSFDDTNNYNRRR